MSIHPGAHAVRRTVGPVLARALVGVAIACAGCEPPDRNDDQTEAPTEDRFMGGTGDVMNDQEPASGGASPIELRAAADAWHADRDTRLRSDTGWLTLVGLHPLVDGTERIGSGEEATIRLPSGVPADVGTLEIDGAEVRFTTAAGADVRVFEGNATFDGRSIAMQGDGAGSPTVLAVDTVLFHVIDRGDARYLRVRDREAAALRAFRGVDRFPFDPAARVVAAFVPDDATIAITDVRGNVSDAQSPGVVEFQWRGESLRLRPTVNDDGSLFIVFGDATSGDETYGGGRFLSADAPDAEGRVVLDFNRAFNPVCAFNAFATCPLPPAGNRLSVAIRAGEKTPLE